MTAEASGAVAGCLACEVVAGRVAAPGGPIFRDERWLVDHSVSPVMLRGFLIVKPIRHVEHLGELTPAEAHGLGAVLRATCAAVMRALEPEKVYVTSFGELVRHVHLYVLPRYPGMPADGIEVVTRLFDGPWACSDGEAAAAAELVRRRWRA